MTGFSTTPAGGFEPGGGVLSAAALARLAKPSAPVSHPLPELAAQSPAGKAAIVAWRAAQHASWGEGAEPGEAEHCQAVIGGVPCLVAGMEATPDTPTLLYLHGGGYCLGSPGVALPITARLARALRVVSVDYRLAPEHPYPAGLDDAHAVFRELAEAGPVAVAGDSAGANLALTIALRAADPAPVAVVLLCPHLDHAAPTARPDGDLAGHDPRLPRPVPHEDPGVSPLRAPDHQLASLPPTLIQTGTADPFFGQAIRFARRGEHAASAFSRCG